MAPAGPTTDTVQEQRPGGSTICEPGEAASLRCPQHRRTPGARPRTRPRPERARKAGTSTPRRPVALPITGGVDGLTIAGAAAQPMALTANCPTVNMVSCHIEPWACSLRDPARSRSTAVVTAGNAGVPTEPRGPCYPRVTLNIKYGQL